MNSVAHRIECTTDNTPTGERVFAWPLQWARDLRRRLPANSVRINWDAAEQVEEEDTGIGAFRRN